MVYSPKESYEMIVCLLASLWEVFDGRYDSHLYRQTHHKLSHWSYPTQDEVSAGTRGEGVGAGDR